MQCIQYRFVFKANPLTVSFINCLALGLLLKIPGIKILRIYGQEIERKEFPVPDKVTLFRSRRVAVELKADKDLRDVSLHHVIRKEPCPDLEELKGYDKAFKQLIDLGKNAPREMIDEFNVVMSEHFKNNFC